MASSEIKNVSKYKVIIIGAGMAGLSAANHFIKNGFNDFSILEARNRIGGRIIGINICDEKIELGANWIHGILGNPIFEIAMSNGLIDIVNIPKPHQLIATTEKGIQAPFEMLKEIYEAYVCFLRRCEEYFLSEYLPPEGVYSVGDHIALEIDMYLKNIMNPDEKFLKQLIFDCLLKRETCITGCDSMREIDLLEMGSYTELQGGNIVLPSGYSSILTPISECIPQEKLLKSHPVKTINWCKNCENQDAAANDSDDSDRTVIDETTNPNQTKLVTNKKTNCDVVEVICENDKTLYADYVICTVPLGVLKANHQQLFNPPLPDDKIDAINNLLFGTVDKIFLKYDRPFLNSNISEIMLLWDPYDCDNGDISEIWFKKIYSFSKVTETVLLGWISGKEAEYMETLDVNVVADKCTEILRQFLNDQFIPKPVKCIW